ncbi:SDR family NAD(P)-dependent oxidoreductase [Leucobacter allii]|uniref:SDR family NAD(P)-dependent oxidoreductase n=1 Tax=Leucobacter allii TaxID=2932247 RepID=A0ABY4FML0_9MICO|nr:SDR family NAD(P)-dependent oxidoreductase [Leucobacter allii]UOQ57505.1 SDR family NAD(P)-dependent oxidoreductase [Leucobacter allii]
MPRTVFPRAAREAPMGARGTALITGASAGLGREFARRLAAARVDLVLVARDENRLAALAAELRAAHGITAETLPADLTDPDDLERVARRLSSEDAPVDLLVNNAGFGVRAGFERSTLAEERRLHELLSWVPLRLAHAAVPGMLARGRGWILNVASVAAFTPTGTYGAAKAAVVSLSRALNARYRGRGLRVTALCPGLLATEFHERMGADHLPRLPRIAWADTERAARDGLRAVRRGRSVVITDGRYRIARGLAALLPDRLLERISTTGG